MSLSPIQLSQQLTIQTSLNDNSPILSGGGGGVNTSQHIQLNSTNPSQLGNFKAYHNSMLLSTSPIFTSSNDDDASNSSSSSTTSSISNGSNMNSIQQLNALLNNKINIDDHQSSSSTSSPPLSLIRQQQYMQSHYLSSLLNDSNNNHQDSSLVGYNQLTKCVLCKEYATQPKALIGCCHILCQSCLERLLQIDSNKVQCPQCLNETATMPSDLQTPSNGNTTTTGSLSSLLSDPYSMLNLMDSDFGLSKTPFFVNNQIQAKQQQQRCQSCKSPDQSAIAKCFNCSNNLCQNCVLAHQYMHCYDVQNNNNNINSQQQDQLKKFQLIVDTSKLHACELRTNCDLIEQTIQYLTQKFHKAQTEVDNTFNFYKQLLDERRYEVQAELETIFNTKHANLQQYLHKLDDLYSKFDYIINFYERLNQQKTQVNELLMFKKPLETKLNTLLLNSHLNENFNQLNNIDLEFISNYQAIQTSIRNTFGYIKATNIDQMTTNTVSATTPTTSSPTNMRSSSSTTSATSLASVSSSVVNLNAYKPKPIGPPPQQQQPQHQQQQLFINDLTSDNNNNTKRLSLNENFNDLTFNAWVAAANTFESSHDLSILNTGCDSLSTSRLNLTLQNTSASIPHNPLIPARSQLKRIKMIYNCKFGEFGINDGQFTEPSGVAISLSNDIIVADTNSHRIQIFDRDGRFKFKFGECGKRDGQLLYPNRASIIKQTGDIVVTERSPTHQIQIYNQYGQFVRKFGANILQHPRGVCVDSKGRIIVVECKVMRVIIFDQLGNVLYKFNCSKYLEFPNGVCCNDKQEIFISDNRAHCIKVFNYDGVFLRQIGGEGITNYPIGVGINLNGDVLIADNHNNFNLTVFTQDGQLINALESKVKHAQCFDVGLMDDGSIVLASKDYRIYVYRYNSQQH